MLVATPVCKYCSITNAETTLNASHRFNDAFFLETGKSLSPSSINPIAKIMYIPCH